MDYELTEQVKEIIVEGKSVPFKYLRFTFREALQSGDLAQLQVTIMLFAGYKFVPSSISVFVSKV